MPHERRSLLVPELLPLPRRGRAVPGAALPGLARIYAAGALAGYRGPHAAAGTVEQTDVL
jgi:hypothetical protein